MERLFYETVRMVDYIDIGNFIEKKYANEYVDWVEKNTVFQLEVYAIPFTVSEDDELKFISDALMLMGMKEFEKVMILFYD